MADVEITVNTIQKANQVPSLISSFTELNSAIALVTRALDYAKQAYEQTIGVLLDYATQVREVSRATGMSAEDSSRLIQLADDTKVSYEQLRTSMMKAVREGFTPSIEGVAELSDQYLKLNPGAERAGFLLNNFGKQGAVMAELMEKGGDAIRVMSESIDESLILNEEAINSTRQYEQAVDNLNDAFTGVKIAVGNALLPPLIHLMEVLTIMGKHGVGVSHDFETLKWQFEEGKISAEQYVKGLTDLGIALSDVPSAADAAGESIAGFGEELDKLDMSSTFNDVTNVQEAYDGVKKATDNYYASIRQVNDELAAGQITQEEATAKLGEIRSAYDEAKAANERWMKQFILSAIQMQMMSDNKLSPEEFSQLMSVGEALGLIDPQVAQTTQDVVNALNATDPQGIQEALDKMKELFSYDGDTITTYHEQIELTGTDGETEGEPDQQQDSQEGFDQGTSSGGKGKSTIIYNYGTIILRGGDPVIYPERALLTL